MDLLRALPIGLYLETPITWMHRLDPRIKLCWLMGFLLTPLLASSLWRLALVGLLIILTWLARIPVRVWQQQMGWLIALACLIFVLTAIAPDGLPGNHQPRRPAQPFLELAPPPAAPAPRSSPLNPLSWFQPAPPAVTTPALPQPTGYQYLLVQQGPVTVTRRSFDLGIRVSTLIFTLIYSTNLYLLTTSPEEITAGLEDILSPLRSFGWPITEIALTLTLALRFIPLVLEEIQNLVRSIWTRAINWKQLGLKRGAAIWLKVAERLLLNLLLRAEQIAGAIQVRGFTTANTHRVQWHDLKLHHFDGLAIAALTLLVVARVLVGAP